MAEEYSCGCGWKASNRLDEAEPDMQLLPAVDSMTVSSGSTVCEVGLDVSRYTDYILVIVHGRSGLSSISCAAEQPRAT